MSQAEEHLGKDLRDYAQGQGSQKENAHTTRLLKSLMLILEVGIVTAFNRCPLRTIWWDGVFKLIEAASQLSTSGFDVFLRVYTYGADLIDSETLIGVEAHCPSPRLDPI
jgi:hypothetical protein